MSLQLGIKFNYKLVSTTHYYLSRTLLMYARPALHAILVVKTTIKRMLLAPSSTSVPRRYDPAPATISVAARACFARVITLSFACVRSGAIASVALLGPAPPLCAAPAVAPAVVTLVAVD